MADNAIETVIQTTTFSQEAMLADIRVDPQDRFSREARRRTMLQLVDTFRQKVGAAAFNPVQQEAVEVAIIVAMIMNGTSHQGTMQGYIHVLGASCEAKFLNEKLGTNIRQFARSWASEARDILLANPVLRKEAMERWEVYDESVGHLAFDFADGVTGLDPAAKKLTKGMKQIRVGQSGGEQLGVLQQLNEEDQPISVVPRATRSGYRNNSGNADLM